MTSKLHGAFPDYSAHLQGAQQEGRGEVLGAGGGGVRRTSSSGKMMRGQRREREWGCTPGEEMLGGIFGPYVLSILRTGRWLPGAPLVQESG